MPRLPPALRAQLAPVAVDAFVEHACAAGVRRERLRGSWQALRELVAIRSVGSAAALVKHEAGALALAGELGKQVSLSFELEPIEIEDDVLAAIDAAVLHLVRNAVDHGIEHPSERVAVGKPERGAIRVRCRLDSELLVLAIEDDGRGVALEEVRARAIDLGWLDPNAEEVKWLDIITQPGFSTRVEADRVSGRGVGLDVVRAAIADVGGTIHATTSEHRGTSWRIAIPMPRIAIRGHALRAPALPFPVFVDETWSIAASAPHVLDVAHRLGLVGERGAGALCGFVRGDLAIGIRVDGPPVPAEARRLVAVPHSAFAEVVAIGQAEGLWIHPEISQ
jgi:two-component sensor histidine kinase